MAINQGKTGKSAAMMSEAREAYAALEHDDLLTGAKKLENAARIARELLTTTDILVEMQTAREWRV